MKKFIFLLLLTSFMHIQAQQPDINWMGFEELEKSLEEEVKPVLIYFYTDWCVYCKKMEKHAFRDSEIVSALNNDFYAVKMNAESTAEIEFEGQMFINEQAKTRRNGIHQIPMLLAGRENKTISFPVILVLNKKFKVLRKSYEYLTTDKMKTLIKG